MATGITFRTCATLLLASAAMFFGAAAQAGPQVTFYLTMPFGGPPGGHVLGLRLDRGSSPPDIRNINPASPLNRRALLDLQLGADSALRLELDRRLTWDLNRLQWRESKLPATFNLRVPTASRASAEERAARAANPILNQSRQALVKPFAIEP